MILGTTKRIWGTKNKHWRPLPKTLHKHNVLGSFFRPRGGKTSFGMEKCNLGGNLGFFLFWSDPCGPGRLRNLNIPIGILRFPARGGQVPVSYTHLTLPTIYSV